MPDDGPTPEERLAAVEAELALLKKYPGLTPQQIARREARDAEEVARMEANREAVRRHRERRRKQDKFEKDLARDFERTGRAHVYINRERARLGPDGEIHCPGCARAVDLVIDNVRGAFQSQIEFDDPRADDPALWDERLWGLANFKGLYHSCQEFKCGCGHGICLEILLTPGGD